MEVKVIERTSFVFVALPVAGVRVHLDADLARMTLTLTDISLRCVEHGEQRNRALTTKSSSNN